MITKEIVEEAIARGYIKVYEDTTNVPVWRAELVNGKGSFSFATGNDIADKVSLAIEYHRKYIDPIEAHNWESVLHNELQGTFEEDFASYDKEFIEGCGRHINGEEVTLGLYLSSLQDVALVRLCKEIGVSEAELPVVSYEEDRQGWDKLADKVQDYFYVEKMLPPDVPLAVKITSTPSVWTFNLPPDAMTNIATMEADVAGDTDKMVQYDPDKGEFAISVMLPGSRLGYYPLPRGSTISFADGFTIPVLEDNELQKRITNPIIAIEGKKEQVWQQKPEPELTTHEACEQLYYAAEKFYDTVLREDWSMRDANKGALDILREVASWKNPQKEQENAR